MTLADLMAAMQQTASVAPKSVDVPGWGVVYVREMTVGEVEEQTEDTAEPKDRQRIARAAARIICDETGKRLFDPANQEHVDLIAKQPWRLLRKVVEMGEGAKNG